MSTFGLDRRVTGSLLLVLPTLAWWGTVVWLSHDVRPWASGWTDALFAGGLLLSYAVSWGLAVLWSAEPRKMVFRALASGLALSMLVAGTELAAWAGWVDFRVVRTRLLDPGSGPDRAFVDDPQLYFRRPADLSWSGRPRSDMARAWDLPLRSPDLQTFTTDSGGFRNSRDHETADVVVLGDSYAEGAYVSDQDTVAAVLERISGRPVVNLAVAGYGPAQQLLTLRRVGLDLQPQLVAWFFFEGNDLYDDHGFELAMSESSPAIAKPRERQAAGKSGDATRWRHFKARSLTTNAVALLRYALHPVLPKTAATFGWFTASDGAAHRMYFYDYATLEVRDYERERFHRSTALLREGAELCRRRGVRLLVFFVPMKFRVYGDLCSYPAGSVCPTWQPWKLDEMFMSFCRGAGIECIDLTGPMRAGAERGELLYAPEDSHWSRRGHDLVARQVHAAWRR